MIYVLLRLTARDRHNDADLRQRGGTGHRGRAALQRRVRPELNTGALARGRRSFSVNATVCAKSGLLLVRRRIGLLRLLRLRIHTLARTKTWLPGRPVWRLLILRCPKQWWLVRRFYQSAFVCGGIVNKLPLVVMVLFVKFADGLVFFV